GGRIRGPLVVSIGAKIHRGSDLSGRVQPHVSIENGDHRSGRVRSSLPGVHNARLCAHLVGALNSTQKLSGNRPHSTITSPGLPTSDSKSFHVATELTTAFQVANSLTTPDQAIVEPTKSGPGGAISTKSRSKIRTSEYRL